MSWFRRRPRIASTGHTGDDLVLAEIAKRSDLSQPREWEHFLYFADEISAFSAAQEMRSAGWDVTTDRQDDGQWLVIASQEQAITSPATVMKARQFFEGIAAARPGAEYDGWGALAG